MHRSLLVLGGLLNSILALFHVWLGWQIHLMTGLNPGHHALMEMLNAGGTLGIAFFAVGSLACAQDLLTTRLGKLLLGVVFLFYLLRAIEEILIAPRFSAVIFGVCLLIAVIYLVVLCVPFAPRQRGAAVPGSVR